MSKKKIITAVEQEPVAEQPADTEQATELAQPVGTPATALKPCAEVRRICAEMLAANPETKRSEIVAACLAIGINKHTAQTQIQKFKSAQKARQ